MQEEDQSWLARIVLNASKRCFIITRNSTLEREKIMSDRAALHPPAERKNARDAVEALFLQYRSQLLNFLIRTLGYHYREDAEDLLQEVFLKAQKSLDAGALVTREAVSSWLYTIAKHTAYDFLRRKRLIVWIPISAFEASPEQSTQAQHREDVLYHMADTFGGTSPYGRRFEDQVLNQELIRTIFQRLPPKWAICLWLFEQEGFSCAEIASQLDISPSAVKMRLMRARRMATEQRAHLPE